MRVAVRTSAIGVAVLAVLVSGCEPEGIDVGAVNECDAEVEADVVSRADLADVDPAWKTIPAGERASVRSVADDADSVYLIVRRPGDTEETRATVPVSRLHAPPEGADYDKEVVLSGRRCPG